MCDWTRTSLSLPVLLIWFFVYSVQPFSPGQLYSLFLSCPALPPAHFTYPCHQASHGACPDEATQPAWGYSFPLGPEAGKMATGSNAVPLSPPPQCLLCPLLSGHRAAPLLGASSKGCFLGGSSILPSYGSEVRILALSKSLTSEALNFGVFISHMETDVQVPKEFRGSRWTFCESGLKTINLWHGIVIRSENVWALLCDNTKWRQYAKNTFLLFHENGKKEPWPGGPVG